MPGGRNADIQITGRRPCGDSLTGAVMQEKPSR